MKRSKDQNTVIPPNLRRRGFLKGVAGTAALGTLASAGWPVRAAWAAPDSDTVRVGLGHGSTGDSLDPGTYFDAYMMFVGWGLRNNLTEIGPSGELLPELAESWDMSADAMKWTFKLRKGVEFHDGKSLTAQDVVASINHHRGDDSSSAARPLLSGVKAISVLNTHTVQITLGTPNVEFAHMLSDFHLGIMPAVDGKADWRSGNGTGGYVLESFEPGERTMLRRNPNYWKKGAAHFEAADIRVIAGHTARTNALITGAVDIIDRADLQTIHLLKKNPDIQVKEVSGTQHYSIPMHANTKPFSDNNVRLALKHGIDRQSIVDNILRGHGRPGNDHPIGVSNRHHAAQLTQTSYDPDKAKHYLKKAGMNELNVDLSAADAAFRGAVDTAALYQEHAERAGINIDVEREPNDGYWSNVWMKKPFSMCYWGGQPTEGWMFSTSYSAEAPWNDMFWKHERFNALLKNALAERDVQKRGELYGELQRTVRDEGSVVIPVFADHVFATSARVKHGELAANWELDGLKGLERWWFA